MKLDVDALLKALDTPTITLGDKEHTLRYPSFIERLKISQAYDSCDWDSPDEQADCVTLICETCGLDANIALGLPESVLSEVIAFLLLMARGVNPESMKRQSTESNES